MVTVFNIIIYIYQFFFNMFLIAFVISLFQVFYPITWEPIPQILQFLHLSDTPDHRSMVVAGAMLLVASALGNIPALHGVLLFFSGATKAKGADAERLQRLWEDVCQRAGLSSHTFRLYILEDRDYNAYAFGRNRVVVHRGLMEFPDDPLKGILAHELGHLKHRDTVYGITGAAMAQITDITLRIYGIFIYVISLLVNIFCFIPILRLFIQLFLWLLTLTLNLLTWIGYLPLNFFSLFTSRQAEYKADRYAYQIGLGKELYDGLSILHECYGNGVNGFFQELRSTHPATGKRLHRLQTYLTTSAQNSK